MGWSCAAATREPRQVGNEATVSGARRVPQGYRAGASGRRVAVGGKSKVGARPSCTNQERRGITPPRRFALYPVDMPEPVPEPPYLAIRDDALASPSTPLALLRQLGLRARKSYSQSFLTDVRLTEQIASAADLSADDQVLEVGPGLGILTRALAKRAQRVVAVELDRDLATVLPRLVSNNVQVVHGDALTLDVAAYVQAPYKVVANLPYQITSPFLFHYLGMAPAPSLMVLMIQKEVAKRIAAPTGQLSYLAVAVQSAACVRIIRLVSPGAFYPRPKVESAVIRLDPLAEPLVPPEQREAFLQLVRAGFEQPRKTLLNSLGQGLRGPTPQPPPHCDGEGENPSPRGRGRIGWTRDEVRALLDAAGIAPDRRPHTLTLADWRTLFDAHQRMRPNHGG